MGPARGGLVGQDRAREAATLAAVLAATEGADAEGHRVRGLSLLVEAAVASGDAAAAVSALASLAAVDMEGAADLAVSVALAFPEAGAGFGRGVAVGPSVAASPSVAAEKAGASPGEASPVGLSTASWPPGVYVVRAAAGLQTMTARLVVAR